jgi:hypothetical protein
MGTKRTPRGYAARMRMTPAAVVMLERMERLSIACMCPEIDWEGEYSKPRGCPACNAWWKLHGELHGELKLPPWAWPAYEYPDAENPYPVGSVAAQHWLTHRAEHPERFEMYQRLLEAAKATKAASA